MIILDILLLAMLLAAILAVESADLLAAAIALAVFGFLASLVFALIGAIELSTIQLVIEFILLVAVIRMAGDGGEKETYKGMRLFYYGGSALSVAFMFLVNYTVFGCLPPVISPFAHRSADLTRYFRGFDPLVVSVVVLASVTGLLAVLRKKGKEE